MRKDGDMLILGCPSGLRASDLITMQRRRAEEKSSRGATKAGKSTLPTARNPPGHWDVFIGHSRRSANAVVLATEIAEYKDRGFRPWLDVRMCDKSEAAMEEGVKNSKLFIAVVTGPCVNNDRPDDDTEGNANFKLEYCIKELRWAVEAGVQIQPVVRLEDKQRIGEFLQLTPLDLRVLLASIDWINLNRSDVEYWEVGMNKVLRAAQGH